MAKDRGFIKISQVVGQARIIGSLSLWQVIPIVAVIGLIYTLCSWLSVNPLIAVLFGAWILGTVVAVAGGRPDRIIRRLLGRPRRWKRGFYPARPLLGKASQENYYHGEQ